MVDLPTGTVTFLFTDIEGSTRLVRELGPRYAQVLAEHQRILRDCFAAHRGREIDSQGDSFFVAFSRAGDAVECAIEAQQALQSHRWSGGVRPRVRMGLHSGEPRASGERYVGFGVHRAARVGAAGHGAQILVSNATRELVEDDLPPHARLRDLGAYRLKDVDRPERLFQVEAEGLERDFGPINARRVGGPGRRRRLVLVLGLGIAAVAAGVFWSTATQGADLGSADRPITIVTGWWKDDVEQKAFAEVLSAFEQTTGHRTEVTAAGSEFQKVMHARIASGDAPTLALVGPGLLADYAHRKLAKPLESLGISDELLLGSFSRTWVELGTVEGKTYGFPIAAGSKSLVWFRPRDFRRMGLDVAETWGELLSLTRTLARGGDMPWAVGGGDSFTLTDWFENIFIRTEGPWKYDALFGGKLPFDDTSAIRALRRMTSILRDPHHAEAALSRSFPEAVRDVFGAHPSAHLLMEGGFVGSFALAGVRPAPVPGQTIGAAPFPTINPDLGNPVLVGADFVLALTEGAAVKDLLLYLTSPGAGRIWVSTGTTVSPNRRIPVSAYPNVLVRRAATQVRSARHVRFDGSDLLPGSLGDELGSTLQNVLRRPADTRQLMRDFQRKAARVFNE
jgi:alpha-glucoside transport system substrate-binding protein